jgi:hypothetical protein
VPDRNPDNAGLSDEACRSFNDGAKLENARNAKRQTPNAKRQTPNAKRQTPNAKRQTRGAPIQRLFFAFDRVKDGEGQLTQACERDLINSLLQGSLAE